MSRPKIIKFENVRLVRNHKLEDASFLWVVDGKIVDPERRFWETSHDRNHSFKYSADSIIDGKGLILAPGYIDLQINGAFGVDFSDHNKETLTREQMDVVSSKLLSHGVTSYCPTVVTSSPEAYQHLLKPTSPICPTSIGFLPSPRFKKQPFFGDDFEVKREINPYEGHRKTKKLPKATILGVHCEGPFISQIKYGAHSKELIQQPKEGFEDLHNCYAFLDNISIVTIAPELDGALECMPELRRRGIVVSLGHTMSSLKLAERSVDLGASLMTHLFNAMPSFHHRDPGIIGLLGSEPNVLKRFFYSIIVDGIHCNPNSVKMAYKCHPSGVVLVTDAIMALGLEPGQYELGGMNITVTEDRAFVSGSDVLAGAVCTMDQCVRNFKEFTHCSIVEAVEAATLHPAQVLRMTHKKGTLDHGCDADFILLADDLEVQATFVNGEEVWSLPGFES